MRIRGVVKSKRVVEGSSGITAYEVEFEGIGVRTITSDKVVGSHLSGGQVVHGELSDDGGVVHSVNGEQGLNG